MGGRRRGGGKRDSQGGGKREKKGKIMQHCAMFCNPKNAKRREPTNTGKELGLKGRGSGRFKPPVPPMMVVQCMVIPTFFCWFPFIHPVEREIWNEGCCPRKKP